MDRGQRWTPLTPWRCPPHSARHLPRTRERCQTSTLFHPESRSNSSIGCSPPDERKPKRREYEKSFQKRLKINGPTSGLKNNQTRQTSRAGMRCTIFQSLPPSKTTETARELVLVKWTSTAPLNRLLDLWNSVGYTSGLLTRC